MEFRVTQAGCFGDLRCLGCQRGKKLAEFFRSWLKACQQANYVCVDALEMALP
jgi:hypothetical protein